MIKNYKSLITELNRQCKLIIGNCQLISYNNDYNCIIYHNDGTQKAINRLEHVTDKEVNVVHWFSDYYLYIEVKFIFGYDPDKKKKKTRIITQCSISISTFKIFSGEIIQLFRAEWDDYNNEQNIHPQPHWHITADASIANTFQDYISTVENKGLMPAIDSQKEKLTSLRKFHFAMKEKWDENGSHFTALDSDQQISSWFCGLLKSIKTELLYVY